MFEFRRESTVKINEVIHVFGDANPGIDWQIFVASLEIFRFLGV